MKAALPILLLALSACTPTNPERWMEMEKNACLPTAISMDAGLRRQGITSRVLQYGYQRGNKFVGHAVTAYLFAPGENKLWVYDYEGSTRTRAFIDDPVQIATQAELARGRNTQIVFSKFLN
jgi:hypothetical protein